MLDSQPEQPEHENERAMRLFCAQFSPPLRSIKTEAINQIRFPNAYQTTWWSDNRAIGITCVSFEGQMHAFIEAAGGAGKAEAWGKVMAIALGLWCPERDPGVVDIGDDNG